MSADRVRAADHARPVSADDRFHAAVPSALRLVGAVRSCDPDDVQQILQRADLPALAIALAAMVDDTRTPSEMLAWTTQELRPRLSCDPHDDHSPATVTAIHGTRSRYNAGCRGEACRAADADYQRARHQRRKRQHLQTVVLADPPCQTPSTSGTSAQVAS